MSRSTFRHFICGVAVLAAPFFISTPARAEEVIQDFIVTADVHTDGTVDIVEKITVNAEGNKIKHGIYRDIPTEFKDAKGRSFHMPFTLKTVSRNERAESYFISQQGNGQRIYIGDKNKYVTMGSHMYTIQYRVARVVGFFPEGDEFYWNVTGNGWDFPIAHASITVNFPNGVKVIKAIGYTGVQGAKGSLYKGLIFGNHYQAETTARLNPHEGFTIAAAVPVGTIQKETTRQQIKYYLDDNGVLLIWMSFAFVSIVYLLMAWIKYGRDISGVIIPRFDPPEKMEPDLLRYIRRQKYDSKTFTTLIVNAASNNKIKIEEEDNATVLTLNSNSRSKDNAVGNMDVILSAFSGLRSIVLPKKSLFGPQIDKDVGLALWNSQQSHKKYVEDDSRAYLDKNTKYVVYGCLIGVVGALWACFWAISEDQQTSIMVWSVLFYAIIFKLFAKIMPQYTLRGQDVMDHAEGLRMYMKTAEQERFNILYPKEITPEKIEKLLPYAVALDVEQEWCDYMAALVRDGTLPPYTDSGSIRGFHGRGYSALNTSLSSLSSAISSSGTAPGSSSGFGSGGGSGGGGGGGGGGGW